MKSLERQEEADRDAHHRGGVEAAAVRQRAHRAASARGGVAGGRAAERLVRQDRRRADGGKRVALTADRAERAGARSKITGPGQRATLSAMLRDGLKAVTVRVNDVDGVGGFVLPGDRSTSR